MVAARWDRTAPVIVHVLVKRCPVLVCMVCSCMCHRSCCAVMLSSMFAIPGCCAWGADRRRKGGPRHGRMHPPVPQVYRGGVCVQVRSRFDHSACAVSALQCVCPDVAALFVARSGTTAVSGCDPGPVWSVPGGRTTTRTPCQRCGARAECPKPLHRLSAFRSSVPKGKIFQVTKRRISYASYRCSNSH